MRPRVRIVVAGLAAALVAVSSTDALAGHDVAAAADRHDPRGLYAGAGVGLSAYLVAPAYGGGPLGNLHVGIRVSELLGFQITLGGLWLVGVQLPGTALGSTIDATARLFIRTSGRWDPYLEGGAGLFYTRTHDPVIVYRGLGFSAGIGHEVHISNFAIGMHARYVSVVGAKATDPDVTMPGNGAMLEGELYTTVRF